MTTHHQALQQCQTFPSRSLLMRAAHVLVRHNRETVRKAYCYRFPAHGQPRQLLIDERVVTANDGGFGKRI
jgi:hypothetical protein